jgi:Na+/melibiose symporter-like transporter
VFKSAYGVMLLLTGFILQATGFAPNIEQAPSARLAIILLYSVFPLICYLIGAWMFSKYSLDEKAHSAIMQSMARVDEPGKEAAN